MILAADTQKWHTFFGPPTPGKCVTENKHLYVTCNIFDFHQGKTCSMSSK